MGEEQDKSKSSTVMCRNVEQVRANPTRDTFTCYLNTPELYQCKLCGPYNSNLKLTLTQHVRVYHKKNQGRGVLQGKLECYQCGSCNFQTYSVLVLLKHTYNNNCSNDVKRWCDYRSAGGVRIFKCEALYCLYETAQLTNIKRHVTSRHTDDKLIRWFPCGLCSYKSKLKSGLKTHILTKHKKPEEVNWYKCTWCTFETPQRNQLINHVNWRHGNEEWTEDELSSVNLKKSIELKVRLILRGGYQSSLKLFDCKNCSYKTFQKSDLNMHNVAKHLDAGVTTQRNGYFDDLSCFKCEYCSYKTKWKHLIKYHNLSKHTDPTLTACYKCELCSYKNVHKRNLKRHVARVHPNVDYNCE